MRNLDLRSPNVKNLNITNNGAMTVIDGSFVNNSQFENENKFLKFKLDEME